MCKGFHADSLEIRGGFHAAAPFKKKGAADLSSAYDGFDDEVVVSQRWTTKREVGRKVTNYDDTVTLDAEGEVSEDDDGPADSSQLNDEEDDDDDVSRKNIAKKIKKKVGHLASGLTKKFFKKSKKTSAEREEDYDDDKDGRDDDLERRLSIL